MTRLRGIKSIVPTQSIGQIIRGTLFGGTLNSQAIRAITTSICAYDMMNIFVFQTIVECNMHANKIYLLGYKT